MRALPLLRVLSIRVDHPSQRDNPAAPGNAGPPSHIIGDEEIPGETLCVCVCACVHTNVQVPFVWKRWEDVIQAEQRSFLVYLKSIPSLESAVLKDDHGLDRAQTTTSPIESDHGR